MQYWTLGICPLPYPFYLVRVFGLIAFKRLANTPALRLKPYKLGLGQWLTVDVPSRVYSGDFGAVGAKKIPRLGNTVFPIGRAYRIPEPPIEAGPEPLTAK